MKKLLEFIVRQIVDEPESVVINDAEKDGETVFELSVSQTDIGKVIGKNGQIIRAIRTLLRTRAFKEGKKVQLVLLESKKQTD